MNAALAAAARAALDAPDVEAGLSLVTRAAMEHLGDPEAHLKPGALKPGERHFRVAGVFLVTPDRQRHLLVAEHGFPPEQHRLSFPLDTAHPGWVIRNRQPLVIPNTDENADFKQILKTARMGSALYAPLFWRGEILGQLLAAAQARNSFGQADLDELVIAAHFASAYYVASGGPEFLRRLA
jgi:signal transduction protein with GAF and PtsI domain